MPSYDKSSILRYRPRTDINPSYTYVTAPYGSLYQWTTRKFKACLTATLLTPANCGNKYVSQPSQFNASQSKFNSNYSVLLQCGILLFVGYMELSKIQTYEDPGFVEEVVVPYAQNRCTCFTMVSGFTNQLLSRRGIYSDWLLLMLMLELWCLPECPTTRIASGLMCYAVYERFTVRRRCARSGGVVRNKRIPGCSQSQAGVYAKDSSQRPH